MTIDQLVSFNGELIPFSDAKIHILTPAMKYGTAVFEGLRAYADDQDQSFVFRMDDHLRRLQESAKVMRFDGMPGNDELRGAILDLLRAGGTARDVHIRLMAWIDGEDGLMIAREPVCWAVAALASRQSKQIREGIHVAVSSWERNNSNAMPVRVKATANYMNGRLAGLQAAVDGYQGTILLNQQSLVSESPATSVFLIKDGVAVTPSISNDILASITRDSLIKLLRSELGLACEERDVQRTELYTADEAFLCGTALEIQPVLSVDRIEISREPGPITRQLQKAYFDAVRGLLTSYCEWLCPVFE